MEKGKYKRTEETKKKMRQSHLGYVMPIEQRKKISQSNILTYKVGGRKGYWLGKKKPPISEESKKKMSIAKKGKPAPWVRNNPQIFKKGQKAPKTAFKKGENCGEKNFNWKKDRTQLKKEDRKDLDTQYKYWMLEVKKRDNWKCKLLNIDCNGRLEAHHIFNWIDYPELRYVINNGITLCHFHHPRKWSEEERMIPIFQEIISKE